jgi:hypothetical protein
MGNGMIMLIAAAALLRLRKRDERRYTRFADGVNRFMRNVWW